MVVVTNFSREFQLKNTSDTASTGFARTKATVALIIYTTMHSVSLTMEMLMCHVVLTLEYSTVLQFVFINSFGEIKVSAMKKCDYAGLFDVTNADAVDRVHVMMYIAFTIVQTS